MKEKTEINSQFLELPRKTRDCCKCACKVWQLSSLERVWKACKIVISNYF